MPQEDARVARRPNGFEQLEDRTMLSAGGLIFYVDADGAEHVDNRGPVAVNGMDVPAFAAPLGLRGREGEILSAMYAELEADSGGSGLEFTGDRPSGGGGGDYSTIYPGGDGWAFYRWGHYYGLAESVDVGNVHRADAAFVFPDAIASAGMSAVAYGRYLAGIVAHEAGHLLGAAHADHDGGAAGHGAKGPLADVAFDPKVHVAVGTDAVADVLDHGKVTIDGHEYAVHPKVIEALQNHRAFYNAGAVGPDGVPDPIMGQFVIHAEEHADWAARVLDMTWRAEGGPTYTATERSSSPAPVIVPTGRTEPPLR